MAIITRASKGAQLTWAEMDNNFTELSGKQNALTFDNSPTSGSNNPVTSDGIKQAINAAVTGLFDDRGNYDPTTTSAFPTASNNGSGVSGAILKGDIWTISVIGNIGGVAVQVGETVRALVDNPGQTASNWDILQAGLGYIPENQNNKKQNINNSNTEFPSSAAVLAALGGKSDKYTPTAVQTTNYNALINDLVLIDASASNVTITIPTGVADKSRIGLKLINIASPYTASIALSGTDVFNKAGGAGTGSLKVVNQAMLIQYQASTGIWIVVADDLSLSALDVRYQAALSPVKTIATLPYNITDADNGCLLLVTSSAAGNVVLDGTVSAGVSVVVKQKGTGQITFTSGTNGPTLESSGTRIKTYGQYSIASLIKESVGTWTLGGDLV